MLSNCHILHLHAEHPFLAAVEAAADVVEWLVRESGETAPYILGE
jgi:hypothetical protein